MPNCPPNPTPKQREAYNAEMREYRKDNPKWRKYHTDYMKDWRAKKAKSAGARIDL